MLLWFFSAIDSRSPDFQGNNLMHQILLCTINDTPPVLLNYISQLIDVAVPRLFLGSGAISLGEKLMM
jgi:hypothetical protein